MTKHHHSYLNGTITEYYEARDSASGDYNFERCVFSCIFFPLSFTVIFSFHLLLVLLFCISSSFAHNILLSSHLSLIITLCTRIFSSSSHLLLIFFSSSSHLLLIFSLSLSLCNSLSLSLCTPSHFGATNDTVVLTFLYADMSLMEANEMVSCFVVMCLNHDQQFFPTYLQLIDIQLFFSTFFCSSFFKQFF